MIGDFICIRMKLAKDGRLRILGKINTPEEPDNQFGEDYEASGAKSEIIDMTEADKLEYANRLLNQQNGFRNIPSPSFGPSCYPLDDSYVYSFRVLNGD